jgi:hypothetical protein
VPFRPMGAEGLASERISLGKTPLIQAGGNTSGNKLFRSQLAGLLSLFPRLEQAARQELLALAGTLLRQPAPD